MSAETDRDAFVVGNHRQTVLPDQLAQMSHFVRLTAEVDFAINDTTTVEILAQGSAVRATICGKDQNRI